MNKPSGKWLFSLFLFFAGLCVFTITPVLATCEELTEEICPACPATGFSLEKKPVAGKMSCEMMEAIGIRYIEKECGSVTCIYGKSETNNPESFDYLEVEISCYRDAKTAKGWYDYHTRGGHSPGCANMTGDPACTYEWTGVRNQDCVEIISSVNGWACNGWAVNNNYLARIKSAKTSGAGVTLAGIRPFHIGRIQQFRDCFASFNPKPALPAGQKTLRGMVYTTGTDLAIPLPLKYARVYLSQDGTRILGVTTNDEGLYEISHAFEKGKSYDIEVEMTCSRGDRDYFSIYNMVEGSDPITFGDGFTYNTDEDLEQDIDVNRIWQDSVGPGTANPFALQYVHFSEALEFSMDYLREDVHLNLPLAIVSFNEYPEVIKNRARYVRNGGKSVIYLSPEHSVPESDLYPEGWYHEFSHYLMSNCYGTEPDNGITGPVPNINHGGYTNPSSSDSWAEGFAHFMAGAMKDRSMLLTDIHGRSVDNCLGVTYSGCLDDHGAASDYEGRAEELAIAGALWDLYDGAGQNRACFDRKEQYYSLILNEYGANLTADQANALRARIAHNHVFEENFGFSEDTAGGNTDAISIPLPELWSVLRTYRADTPSFYNALIAKYPDKKEQINEVFKMHGLWKDTGPGNSAYDRGEPFRDGNGNNVHDEGEYFVDMPPVHQYDPGEIIGTASDYNRTWRSTVQPLPGQFVKVNNAVPYYSYTVEYPGTTRPSYTRMARNSNGYVYVPVPPEPSAKITVRAEGVASANPLVFTSQQFRDNYNTAVRQGYIASHDFQVTGPVPPAPVIPDTRRLGSLQGRRQRFTLEWFLAELFRPNSHFADWLFGSRASSAAGEPAPAGTLAVLPAATTGQVPVRTTLSVADSSIAPGFVPATPAGTAAALPQYSVSIRATTMIPTTISTTRTTAAPPATVPATTLVTDTRRTGCPSGLASCSGSCVSLYTSNANCGSCGNACPAGQSCVSGKCMLTCLGGTTNCNGMCVSLQTSNANCGSCNHKCRADQKCQAGNCVQASCPKGATNC